MVCLDTSVLIAILRKDKSALDKLRSGAELGTNLSTTVINLCELYSGAYGSKEPEKELDKIKNIVTTMRILEFSEASALKYGELVNTLKKNQIGVFDLIISCIAMENGEFTCYA